VERLTPAEAAMKEEALHEFHIFVISIADLWIFQALVVRIEFRIYLWVENNHSPESRAILPSIVATV
jgi:hypothetical protein